MREEVVVTFIIIDSMTCYENDDYIFTSSLFIYPVQTVKYIITAGFLIGKCFYLDIFIDLTTLFFKHLCDSQCIFVCDSQVIRFIFIGTDTHTQQIECRFIDMGCFTCFIGIDQYLITQGKFISCFNGNDIFSIFQLYGNHRVLIFLFAYDGSGI